MKKTSSRVLALLLGLLLFALPVMAGAESTGVHFVLSDPKLTVEGTDVDFGGLSLTVNAEQAENLFNLALKVAASGNDAISAHLAAGSEGVMAYVEGMSSGFLLTAETIQAYAAQILESAGLSLDADGNISLAGSLDLEDLLSEESLEAYANALTEILNDAVSSEPEADTFVNLLGQTVDAQRVDFSLTKEDFGKILQATADLLDANPKYAEILNTALATQGVEQGVAEMLSSSADSINASLSGSLYIANESMDIHAEGGFTVYETTIPFDLDVSSSENGITVTGAMHQPDEGPEQVAFTFIAAPSTAVEGSWNVYFEGGLYSTEENGSVTAVSGITVDAYPEILDGSDYPAYTIAATVYGGSDDTYFFQASACQDPENLSARVLFGSYSEYESGEIVIAFQDGKLTDTSLTGALVISLATGEGNDLAPAYALTANVEIGVLPEGETVAYDFSGLDLIDVSTISDDVAEGLSEEISGVASNALGVLMNVPGVAMLLSSGEY